MKTYKNVSIQKYTELLSARKPVPGGGSAAALTGSVGVGLLLMAAHYSVGKGRTKAIERKIKSTIVQLDKIRKQLIDLVDLDAAAYLALKDSAKADKRTRNKAKRHAQKVPHDIAKQCYKAVDLAPFLVTEGNVHLLSDIQAGVEMLLAAFNSAMIMVEVNS